MTLSKPARGKHVEPFDRTVELPERGPATANAPVPALIIVEVNTWVLRADLGPNSRTFVAAGDAVPAGLESYPRVPA